MRPLDFPAAVKNSGVTPTAKALIGIGALVLVLIATAIALPRNDASTPGPDGTIHLEEIPGVDRLAPEPYVRRVDSARVDSLRPSFRTESDVFSDEVVYAPRNSAYGRNNENALYPVIFDRRPGEEPVLALRFVYSGPEWVFAEEVRVKVEDEVYTFRPRYDGFQREAAGRGVVEIATVPLTRRRIEDRASVTENPTDADLIGEMYPERGLELVHHLAALDGREPVEIQLRGDRRVEFSVPRRDLSVMDDALALYDALGGEVGAYHNMVQFFGEEYLTDLEFLRRPADRS